MTELEKRNKNFKLLKKAQKLLIDMEVRRDSKAEELIKVAYSNLVKAEILNSRMRESA